MEQNKPKPNHKAGIAVIAVFFTIIFLFFKCSCEDSPEDIEMYKQQDRKFTVEVLARQFVEEKLMSPSSAEFGQMDVKKNSDSVYFVKGYVDSQNGFGAMLRSDYYCYITLMTDSTGVCNEIVIK